MNKFASDILTRANQKVAAINLYRNSNSAGMTKEALFLGSMIGAASMPVATGLLGATLGGIANPILKPLVLGVKDYVTGDKGTGFWDSIGERYSNSDTWQDALRGAETVGLASAALGVPAGGFVGFGLSPI